MGDVSFAADKARVLGQVDLSRKGSVDAAIAPLLAYVNAQEYFYSTSSCAGRLVVFAEVIDCVTIEYGFTHNLCQTTHTIDPLSIFHMHLVTCTSDIATLYAGQGAEEEGLSLAAGIT